ncbi:23S rRNA (uracil(1939)-C(5))-methyltransferase RlmD [Aliidiomarina celeris]|uniref:23S rRNA (uracil(1939)-C(5))-methyltransferase RlmD n=1 Tax=Aliidiomarina celeris TaxID=2249428 RepID=UPI000DE9E2FA|nr:23S rRNA (uracil(1939)-C(5))-methyltransferase RlmD [Aliidiomarina celeris]
MPSLLDRRKGFRPQKKKLSQQALQTAVVGEQQGWQILRLNHDGRGVAKNVNGKTVFVTNALPGESVRIRIDQNHSRFDEATAVEVLKASAQRTEPFCPHYQSCGGCQLQHLHYAEQMNYKEQVLREQLDHYSALKNVTFSAPVSCAQQQQGYRRRARLSIPAPNSAAPYLGFRGKGSQRVVAIEQCAVLHPLLNALIKPLQDLIAHFPKRHTLGHVELQLNEHNEQNTVTIIIRTLKPFLPNERELIEEFAAQHGCDVIADYGDSVEVLHAHSAAPLELGYKLKQAQLTFGFNEFVQVNPFVNQAMIDQALDWLNLSGNEYVLELFAGFGNFSIPLAQSTKAVVAVEVASAQVQRGQQNAAANGCRNLEFLQADLSQPFRQFPFGQKPVDVLFLDPPRAGALEVVEDLSTIQPSRILYVSCNPATLARDIATMVEQGYSLEKICVMDMFAHTSHTEAMALLHRNP